MQHNPIRLDDATQVETLLAPLRAGYVQLLDRVKVAAQADDRIRAMWLHGSVAKRLADSGSDLDVIVTVADDTIQEFSSTLQEWVSRTVPNVFTKVNFGRVILVLTPELLRFDLMVEATSQLPRASDRHRVLVFQRGDIATALPPAEPERGPDPAVVDTLIKDFIGELSMMTTIISRQDWLFGTESVHRSRMMIHQILAEGNRPLPPHGAKRLSAQLTSEQRAAFAALPGVAATGTSVVRSKWATVDVFYSLVPATAIELGVSWPVDFEDAVARHLRAELQYDLPRRQGRTL